MLTLSLWVISETITHSQGCIYRQVIRVVHCTLHWCTGASGKVVVRILGGECSKPRVMYLADTPCDYLPSFSTSFFHCWEKDTALAKAWGIFWSGATTPVTGVLNMFMHQVIKCDLYLASAPRNYGLSNCVVQWIPLAWKIPCPVRRCFKLMHVHIDFELLPRSETHLALSARETEFLNINEIYLIPVLYWVRMLSNR